MKLISLKVKNHGPFESKELRFKRYILPLRVALSVLLISLAVGVVVYLEQNNQTTLVKEQQLYRHELGRLKHAHINNLELVRQAHRQKLKAVSNKLTTIQVRAIHYNCDEAPQMLEYQAEVHEQDLIDLSNEMDQILDSITDNANDPERVSELVDLLQKSFADKEQLYLAKMDARQHMWQEQCAAPSQSYQANMVKRQQLNDIETNILVPNSFIWRFLIGGKKKDIQITHLSIENNEGVSLTLHSPISIGQCANSYTVWASVYDGRLDSDIRDSLIGAWVRADKLEIVRLKCVSSKAGSGFSNRIQVKKLRPLIEKKKRNRQSGNGI